MRQLSKTYKEFAALCNVKVSLIEKCVDRRILRANKKKKRVYMDVLSAMFLDAAMNGEIQDRFN